jgi:phosphoribosyl 1,2-cyclic phosphate phosphodiesterase
MEILFLGTSAAEGWPALFCTCENCQRAAQAGGKNVRTRPSTLIDGTILVDPGPDMHHHALAYGLRFADLEGIVVTHAHADHLAADEFHFTCSPFSHRDMTRRLSIWGNETVLELIRRAIRTDPGPRPPGGAAANRRIHDHPLARGP